ncbi:MAG: hypothetical protein J7L15_04180 [Clostridiales bacterium]|nr:hypothetical protein [Clostridiales bacterium]
MVKFLADIFDNAIVGTGRKNSKKVLAVYDSQKILDIIIKEFNKSELEAYEYFEKILKEAYAGDYDPIFICDFRGIADTDDEMKNLNNCIKNKMTF